MRRLLLLLYPRAWRQRYEAEFLALLAQEPLTSGACLDIVRGALDARRQRFAGRSRALAPGSAAGTGDRRARGRQERPMQRGGTAMRCSFCGKDRDQALRLIAGPSVFVCDACVTLCNGVLAGEKASASAWGAPLPRTPKQRAHSGHRARGEHGCSFCGKAPRGQVCAVAGPGGVSICSDCVALCNRLLRDPGSRPPATAPCRPWRWWLERAWRECRSTLRLPRHLLLDRRSTLRPGPGAGPRSEAGQSLQSVLATC